MIYALQIDYWHIKDKTSDSLKKLEYMGCNKWHEIGPH